MKLFGLRTRRFAPIALALLMALTACGKKGPVQPLLGALPNAPQNPQIHQRGQNFIVSWDLPTENEDGTPAEDIGAFHIYRSTYAVTEGCPTCREPQQRVARIPLKYPVAQRIGQRFYWQDNQVIAGYGYRYRIVSAIIGGREGSASTVHRDWLKPPPPPEQLQAHADREQILLEWQAPAQLPATGILVGYNLYRRPAGSAFPMVPLNAEPLKVRQIVDRSLQPGRSYEFRVSTLLQLEESLLESTPTAVVRVTRPAAE